MASALDILSWILLMLMYFGLVILVISFGSYDTDPLESDCNCSCLTLEEFQENQVQAVIASRFCEGLGLQSSVFVTQDEKGTTYGLPICLEVN